MATVGLGDSPPVFLGDTRQNLHHVLRALQTLATHPDVDIVETHFNQVELLRNEVAAHKTVTASLATEQSAYKARVEELEKSETWLADENRRLQRENSESVSLVDGAIAARDEATRLTKESQSRLDDQHVQIQQMKDSTMTSAHLQEQKEEELQRLLARINTMVSEEQRLQERLDKFEAPTSRLVNDDITTVVERFDSFWIRIKGIVATYFYEDLPDEVFAEQRLWECLEQSDVLKHPIPIPIPRSNSECAKDMRVTIIVSILARLLDEHIFHPNNLFEGGSETRHVFLRLAIEDGERESFCRAIISESLEKEQVDAAKNRAAEVVMQMQQHVKGLLTKERYTLFEADLENVVHSAIELWTTISRNRLFFEPNFPPDLARCLPWTEFSAISPTNAAVTLKSKAVKNPGVLVVLPWLYVVRDNQEPEPVSCGAVLRKGQIAEAEQEVETEQRNSQKLHLSNGQNMYVKIKSRHGRKSSISYHNNVGI